MLSKTGFTLSCFSSFTIAHLSKFPLSCVGTAPWLCIADHACQRTHTQALVHAQVLIWSHCHCNNELPGHSVPAVMQITLHSSWYTYTTPVWENVTLFGSSKASLIVSRLLCSRCSSSRLQMFDADTEETAPTQEHFLSIADVSSNYNVMCC